MDELAVVASVLYQFGTNAAFLLLCALGLIVILGMMNIINLAHGELMMLGAYTATIVYQRGAPFWLSVICAFVVVGIIGAILERLVVRRFYGRELGALVVTWGISLMLAQGTLLLLGPFMPAIPIPGGNFAIGQYSFSDYWVGMIVLCALLVWSDPTHVGLGMLAVIAAGAGIYLTIPKSRRGRSIDTQAGHL